MINHGELNSTLGSSATRVGSIYISPIYIIDIYIGYISDIFV